MSIKINGKSLLKGQINGKEIQKIVINGNTVYTSHQVGWYTIWEGSKTVSITGGGASSSGAESNFAYTVAGTGTNPKIRITYTISSPTPTGSLFAKKNFANGVQGNIPSSPYTIEAAITNGYLIATEHYRVGSESVQYMIVSLESSGASGNRIAFSLVADHSTAKVATYNSSITITKIEQYY